MAVREVIHFPFRAQLVAHPEVPTLFLPELVAESTSIVESVLFQNGAATIAATE